MPIAPARAAEIARPGALNARRGPDGEMTIIPSADTRAPIL